MTYPLRIGQHTSKPGTREINVDRLLLIVAGAHLRAEQNDRPIAYGVREAVKQWLMTNSLDEQMQALVCTDVWYLNNDELRNCPTICIGAPGVNALSAYLADKLPTAFVVEGVLSVQLDLDWPDMIANCWGVDQQATASAAEAFVEKYLDGFMAKATRAFTSA